MDVSSRLSKWILDSFPTGTGEAVLRQLGELPIATAGGQDPERIQAAMVLGTWGSYKEFLRRVELAGID